MYTLLAFVLGGGKGTRISAIIGGVLFVVMLSFMGLKQIEIHRLNSKIQEQNTLIVALTKNNEILKKNQITLIDTNKSNYDTAKKLDDERAKSKAAVASLAKENAKSREALDILRKTVATMSNDPKNDGPVAEVLKQTIRQIQKQRDLK